jgi:hypothetical protein
MRPRVVRGKQLGRCGKRVAAIGALAQRTANEPWYRKVSETIGYLRQTVVTPNVLRRAPSYGKPIGGSHETPARLLPSSCGCAAAPEP